MTLVMFDSVNVAELPEGDYAYGAYTSGLYPTLNAVVAKFPGKTVLSIAVTAREDAECLDIERRDATNADAPTWVQRQIARGIQRPVLYTSVSNIDALMASSGISRASVRLWSAHYGAGEHICGPNTCRLCNVQVDGTQWDDHAMGRNLDQSVLADDFFQQEQAMTLVIQPMGAARQKDIDTNGWTFGARGHVYAFGTAPYFGGWDDNTRADANRVCVALVPTLSGNGYWLVSNRGEVFAYGDAYWTGNYQSSWGPGVIVGAVLNAHTVNGGVSLVRDDGQHLNVYALPA